MISGTLSWSLRFSLSVPVPAVSISTVSIPSSSSIAVEGVGCEHFTGVGSLNCPPSTLPRRQGRCGQEHVLCQGFFVVDVVACLLLRLQNWFIFYFFSILNILITLVVVSSILAIIFDILCIC